MTVGVGQKRTLGNEFTCLNEALVLVDKNWCPVNFLLLILVISVYDTVSSVEVSLMQRIILKIQQCGGFSAHHSNCTGCNLAVLKNSSNESSS